MGGRWSAETGGHSLPYIQTQPWYKDFFQSVNERRQRQRDKADSTKWYGPLNAHVMNELLRFSVVEGIATKLNIQHPGSRIVASFSERDNVNNVTNIPISVPFLVEMDEAQVIHRIYSLVPVTTKHAVASQLDNFYKFMADNKGKAGIASDCHLTLVVPTGGKDRVLKHIQPALNVEFEVSGLSEQEIRATAEAFLLSQGIRKPEKDTGKLRYIEAYFKNPSENIGNTFKGALNTLWSWRSTGEQNLIPGKGMGEIMQFLEANSAMLTPLYEYLRNKFIPRVDRQTHTLTGENFGEFIGDVNEFLVYLYLRGQNQQDTEMVTTHKQAHAFYLATQKDRGAMQTDAGGEPYIPGVHPSDFFRVRNLGTPQIEEAIETTFNARLDHGLIAHKIEEVADTASVNRSSFVEKDGAVHLTFIVPNAVHIIQNLQYGLARLHDKYAKQAIPVSKITETYSFLIESSKRRQRAGVVPVKVDVKVLEDYQDKDFKRFWNFVYNTFRPQLSQSEHGKTLAELAQEVS